MSGAGSGGSGVSGSGRGGSGSGGSGSGGSGTGGVEVDAIVLAGGRGSRLGGVDKAALEFGGSRLVDRVVCAAREAGAARVIVAGPAEAGALADRVVREEPPFSGPLAALAAALPETRAPWILLLSCDLVRPAEAVRELSAALGRVDAAGRRESEPAARSESAAARSESVASPPAPGGALADGAILVDEHGQPQWLLSCLRAAPLRAALARAEGEGGSLADLPLRAVLGRLDLQRVAPRPGSTDDIDTPEHLDRARRHARATTSRKARA